MIRPRLSALLRRLADRIAPAPQSVTRADLDELRAVIAGVHGNMIGADASLAGRIDALDKHGRTSNAAISSQYRRIAALEERVWQSPDAFPRYPDGWTPDPERGERLCIPGWTVERDVDGRRVLLSFNPWRADGEEIRVGVLAWVGNECVSLGSDLRGVPDIAHVAINYDFLARKAVDVAQSGGKA